MSTTQASTGSPANGKKLNLGCGQFPLTDYVNVDFSPRAPADVLCDLSHFPYPFTPEGFDGILASHVLEHLPDPLAAMREWHRLLKPGGQLLVKVPHFSRGFTHPDHRRGFDVSFPLFFNPEYPPWFTGTRLNLKRLRLRWNAQPYLKEYVVARPFARVAQWIGGGIDAVANLHPMAFSRLLTFWVGGFEEIEFDFVKPG